MRLLTTDSKGKISLVGPFARNEAPRYAILSHTWGSDKDEVKLQDLRDGTAQTKPGWRKIDFCQQQAIADGIDYFWIDTCCIDKTSSAELSEAINSMYRWYRDSARCYAFLDDVTTYSTQRWEELFMASRWLTRGWTLQELLAPSSVQFFSQEGRLLGDKASLAHLLSKATTIPAAALVSLSPTRFSRHEMMRWVQCRNTKREEDKAYCMLGLLQVTLPVNYGEGYEDACARLDEAIQRKFGCSVGLGQGEEAKNTTSLSEADKSYLRLLWFAEIVKRKMSIRRPVAGTLSWLFEHSHYRSWEESYLKRTGKNLLWIKGNPGVGKSVLMKEAARRISASTEDKRGIVVTHFLDAKGHGLENSPVGLFRSLLYQLLQHNRTYLRKLSVACEEQAVLHSNADSRLDLVWTQDNLETMLDSIISDMSDRCITIFVDALDECNTNTLRQQASFWRELAERFSNLRLCISCRHFPHLFEGQYPVISVEVNNRQDIDEYVRQRMRPYENSTNADWSPLRQSVIAQARGVFLWTVLVLDQLLGHFDDGQSLPHLFKVLEEVPDNLAAIFDQILADIRSSSQAVESLSILHWAVLARKALRVEEWHHIMAITNTNQYKSLSDWKSSDDHIKGDDQLEKKLRAMSRGLVEITIDLMDDVPDTASTQAYAGSLDLTRGGSRFVQVIHSSVRDHLSPTSSMRILELDSTFSFEGHLNILLDCLRYLELAELDEYVGARLRALEVASTIRRFHTSPARATAIARTDAPASRDIRAGGHQHSEQATTRAFHLQNSERDISTTSIDQNTEDHPRICADFRSIHDNEDISGGYGNTAKRHNGIQEMPARVIDQKDYSLPSRADEVAAGLGAHPYQCSRPTASKGLKRRRLSSPAGSLDTPFTQLGENWIITEAEERLVRFDPAVLNWLESLELDATRGFSPPPRTFPTSSIPGGSIASTRGTGSTRILEDHMALLNYITAHFWDHARLLEGAEQISKIVIEQFCTPRLWRRWQAVDVSAPYAPEVADVDLQCAYFKHLGLSSWVEYLQNRNGTAILQRLRAGTEASQRLASMQYEQAIDDAMERSLQRRGSVASFGSAGSHASRSNWG